MFAAGNKVQAIWRKNGKWYAATVEAIGDEKMQKLHRYYYVRFSGVPTSLKTDEHWVDKDEIR